MNIGRIILITRRTRLEELELVHMTRNMVEFILETQGDSIADYLDEHDTYHLALDQIRQGIPSDIQVVSIERNELPRFLFRDSDVIVACGPDGLFANLAQYIRNQIVIPINPDIKRIDGVLMIFRPQHVGALIGKILEDKHHTERLPLIKATINNEKTLWGINDLFIGRRDQIAARYTLLFDGIAEEQCSSGIVVSTGIGSTGWIKSITEMVKSMAGLDYGETMLGKMPKPTDLELIFAVREAFRTRVTRTEMTYGHIAANTKFEVISKMPKGGAIFTDGMVDKALEWKAGSKVHVSIGERFVQRAIP